MRRSSMGLGKIRLSSLLSHAALFLCAKIIGRKRISRPSIKKQLEPKNGRGK